MKQNAGSKNENMSRKIGKNGRKVKIREKIATGEERMKKTRK